MESLTLSDYRGSTRFPAPISYDSSPRLPTPEASCSGSEGIGNSSSRRQSRHRTSLNDKPFSSTMDCYKTGSRSFASPRRLHATPHSPPVHFSESQKPSLPPLKTVSNVNRICAGYDLTLKQVLASSITSPPQSPTAAPSALQPRPCEPAYTTSTYKPPSLYPSKKQRTEPLPECYPLTRPGTMSPSRTASCSLHPGYACPADGSHCLSSAGNDMRAPRRLSVQQPPHIPSHPFGPASMTPEKCPGRMSREPSIDGTRSGRVPMFKPVHVAPSHDHDVHDLSVHRTTNVGFPSPREANDDHLRPRNLAYHTQLTPRESHGSRIDNARLTKRDCWPAPQASSPYGGYESPQSQYFMQAHYEYQHGKTRKRSNLPKQSTEIMKTWFDEVQLAL